MTVIAWDGVTLAADKRALCAGKATTVTKIFRSKREPTTLLAFSGCLTRGLEFVKWFDDGADPKNLPQMLRGDDGSAVMANPQGLFQFEYSAVPFKIEDRYYASGSGRDYALAAMYLGKTAVEAVQVASHFDTGCGNGVDAMRPVVAAETATFYEMQTLLHASALDEHPVYGGPR